MKRSYFIFDLDDTLVYEIDYLKSAYQEIALMLQNDQLLTQMLEWYQNKTDVFQKIEDNYAIKKTDLLERYRTHLPTLSLSDGAESVLKQIKSKGHLLGLITDGRSITQRNKLKSLGIEELFDKIIISEEFGSTKPDSKNYEIFIQKDVDTYFYIGDNTNKDFISPNNIGWTTICLLDKGQNIHKQNFNLPQSYLPQYSIKNLEELNSFIKNA